MDQRMKEQLRRKINVCETFTGAGKSNASNIQQYTWPFYKQYGSLHRQWSK